MKKKEINLIPIFGYILIFIFITFMIIAVIFTIKDDLICEKNNYEYSKIGKLELGYMKCCKTVTNYEHELVEQCKVIKVGD